MNQIRPTTGFVFLAIGTLAIVGCQNAPAEPVGSASLTSAEVVAGAPPPSTDREEELTCDPSLGANTLSCSGPATTAPITTIPFVAAKHTTLPAVRHVATSKAHADESAALAEAIRHEAAGDEHESTASADPVSDGVTMTSALAPAPAFAPTRVTFANHLSRTYHLARLRMIVDGAVYYDGATATTIQVPAGDHTVEVVADYLIPDSIFSSAGDSRMEVTSTQSVHAGGGDYLASADPTGGVTTPIEQRVKVGWRSVGSL